MDRYLIVKTSSLGDIVQSFGALAYLHAKAPESCIDWVVEQRFAPIVAAHPFVSRVISFDLKGRSNLFQSIRELRGERYRAVFDLQGNCKSGVLTSLAKGTKVGFGSKSVREWPNLLATQKRFEVNRSSNIRLQYISLLAQFFEDVAPVQQVEGVRFKLQEGEKRLLEGLFSHQKPWIMVCPGSKWINKQLTFETLLGFLQKIEGSFLLVSGSEEERRLCEQLQRGLQGRSKVAEPMSLPVWQNAMAQSDLVIAVDSAALHLCATTSTPSFSIFGPTSKEIFKPFGEAHFAFQGRCPYSVQFTKQCPRLRSCPTGSCIRGISEEELWKEFSSWWRFDQSRGSARRPGSPLGSSPCLPCGSSPSSY